MIGTIGINIGILHMTIQDGSVIVIHNAADNRITRRQIQRFQNQIFDHTIVG